MRRFALWLCVLPLLAACSDENLGDAQGWVTANPDKIAFGKLFVGSSAGETVVLSNSGRTPTKVTAGTLPAGYQVRPATVDIPGKSSVEVTVSFNPETVGPANGDIELKVTGAKNDTLTIGVEGEGVEDVLEYEELDFGLVRVGDGPTEPLHVKSRVDFPITATLAVVGGNGADVFSVASTTLELGPGEEKDIDVTFRPSRRGDLSSFLEVNYCENCAATRIRLKGVGGLDTLQASPVDFFTRPAGSETRLPLSVQNVGDFGVSIARLDLGEDSPFAIADDRPVDLAPGEVVEYTVVFRAGNQMGAVLGNVRFVDPEGAIRPEVVPLKAKVGGIQIVSTPEGLDFGRQPIGVKVRKTIVVENVGERKLVYLLDQPTIDGSFRMVPTLPAEAFGSVIGWKLDLDGRPLSFEVEFESAAVGEFAGELNFLIATEDGSISTEQANLTVPLFAQAIEPLPCNVQIDPPQVRFGAVWASRIYKKDISVTNVGTDECFLWDVDLDETTPNRYFALEELMEGTYVLQPGQSLNARIIYSPRVKQAAIDEAFFVFQQPGGEVKTPVTGQAVGFNLVVEPNPLSHGMALLGEKVFKGYSIANRGSTSVIIEGLNVSGGDSDFFGFDNAAGGTITGGGTNTGNSWFKPTMPGTRTSQMEIKVRGVNEPMLVDMRGTGADEICGERCAAPIALCPAPISVTVNNTAQVNGSGVSPGGYNVQCQWTVVQAPRGSRVQPGAGCKPNFTPDIVGDYVLELRVTDDNDVGNWDSCQTTLTARAYGGIWVEMFWDKAGDIDLHLVNEAMGSATNQSSWWAGSDCYYGSRTPTWDSGIAGASPSLDRDDTQATGPENIRINNPAPHGYAVGVHNYSNSRTPVEITVNIYCGGSLIENITTITRTTKEFFVLGSIDHECRWTPYSTMWTGFH